MDFYFDVLRKSEMKTNLFGGDIWIASKNVITRVNKPTVQGSGPKYCT